MTNRIDVVMAELKAQNRKALVPYLPVGYPEAQYSLPLLHDLVEAGVDMIELGVPFSDPMADGPVIQKATEIALKNGMNLNKVLDNLVHYFVLQLSLKIKRLFLSPCF